MTFDRRARHRYTGWSIIGGWRLAAVLVLLACGRAGADAVTDWNTFTVSLIAPRPEVTVATAYVHIAIFDAINAIEGGFTPFAVRMSDVPTGASPVAAAAAAAHVILSRLYPSFQSQIDAEYYSAIAKTPPGQGRTDGIAVGEAAANGLLTLHAWPNDGWNANVPYTFQPAGPGVYQQTPGPPPSGAYIGPVTPWLKQFRPFSMRRPSQFRGDGPPPLSSKRWARAFNEVKDLGALTGSIRTPEQSEIGLFYGAIVAGIQIGGNLRNLAAQQRLGLADDARFFAQTYVSMSDSLVACWDSKYFYNFWRPVTAIRAAEIDGNDATQPDPAWLPQVITPGHPEYPTAHGCLTSAYANTIAHFFGTRRLSITLTGPAGHPDRTFSNTDDIIKEIINARVYNGVHYRFSIIDGAKLGRQVARWVARHNFRVDSDDDDDPDSDDAEWGDALTTLSDARGARTLVVIGDGAVSYVADGRAVHQVVRRTAFGVLEAARLYVLLKPQWVIVSGGIPDPMTQARPESEIMRDELVRLVE